MRTEIVDEDPCWHGHNGESDEYNESNTIAQVESVLAPLEPNNPGAVLEAVSGGPGRLPRTKASALVPNKTDS